MPKWFFQLSAGVLLFVGAGAVIDSITSLGEVTISDLTLFFILSAGWLVFFGVCLIEWRDRECSERVYRLLDDVIQQVRWVFIISLLIGGSGVAIWIAWVIGREIVLSWEFLFVVELE